MTPRSLITTVLALAVALVSSTAAAKVNVVTTIQTFRSLAEEVGGPDVNVTALVGEAVDPHMVDPRPSYALTLNKADLLVFVGLELEKGWLPPLIAQSRNPRIQNGQPGNLDASIGIAVLDVGTGATRAQGDVHPLGNPHYWLPPANARRVARAIADRLSQLDGAHAVGYEARFKAFSARLDEREKVWATRAAPLRGVKIITYHKSWSYLVGWLGLVEVGQIEPKPGVPPDPKHLAGLVRAAKGQARMTLVESYYPRNTAQKVSALAGLGLAVLPSDAGGAQRGYVELVDHLITQLLAAAARPPGR